MGVARHKKLRVWRDGVELSLEIYRLTGNFPRHELWGLGSQMRRAAVSVPANIAEGANRDTDREFRRFPLIARGSLAELDTHLILAGGLGYLDAETLKATVQRCEAIARELNALLPSLRQPSVAFRRLP
jgi:four helix bundle protein